MPALPDFTSTTTFPLFANVPSASAEDANGSGEDAAAPYYLVAQIKDDMTITKPTLILRDRTESPFALVFEGYDRDGLDLRARGLRKGATAVIPNARKVVPEEAGKRPFVRVAKQDADRVQAVPGELMRVMTIGARLAASSEEDEGRCDACGKGKEEEEGKGLMKCTGCGVSRYCGKVSLLSLLGLRNPRGGVRYMLTRFLIARPVRSQHGMRATTKPTARFSRRFYASGPQRRAGTSPAGPER
jgi:hypothetical protein